MPQTSARSGPTGQTGRTVCVSRAQNAQLLSLGHSQASAEALLDQLPDGEGVQAVVMDMTEGYRQAFQRCCPRAAIVVDKFHVLSHVLNALQRVCSQVQSQANREDIAILRRRSLSPPSQQTWRLLNGSNGTACWPSTRS